MIIEYMRYHLLRTLIRHYINLFNKIKRMQAHRMANQYYEAYS